MSGGRAALMARRQALIAQARAHRDAMAESAGVWAGTLRWIDRIGKVWKVSRTILGIVAKIF